MPWEEVSMMTQRREFAQLSQRGQREGAVPKVWRQPHHWVQVAGKVPGQR